MNFGDIVFKHPPNISLIVYLSVNISGSDDNNEYSYNISFISILLLEFHNEISGNDDNDEDFLLNILFMHLILLVFHFEISGNDDNDEHLLNI